MKNSKIIELIYKYDLNSNFKVFEKIMNKEINDYKPIIFVEMLKIYEDLYNLKKRLEDENYKLTEQDKEILFKHNICLSKENFVILSIDNFNLDNFESIEKDLLSENARVFIMGDSLYSDKSSYQNRIETLIKIYELSKKYKNRLIYIPGIFDRYLYGYLFSDNKVLYDEALKSILGDDMIANINAFKLTDYKDLYEMGSWLGSLPIQRAYNDGISIYLMASSFFSDVLYTHYPDYCLKDYFSNVVNNSIQKLSKIVIGDKTDYDYNNSFPTYSHTMIISDDSNLSKNNIKIDSRPIVYIYGTKKYYGQKSNGIILTEEDYIGKITLLLIKYLKKTMVGVVNSDFFEDEFNGEYVFKQLKLYNKNIIEIIKDYFAKDGITFQSDTELLNAFLTKVMFDYIIRLQKFKYGLKSSYESIKEYVKNINSYANPVNITRLNSARDIAKLLKKENIDGILELYNCDDVEEYLDLINNMRTKAK